MYHQTQNKRQMLLDDKPVVFSVEGKTRTYFMPLEPPNEENARMFVAFCTKSAIRRLRSYNG